MKEGIQLEGKFKKVVGLTCRGEEARASRREQMEKSDSKDEGGGAGDGGEISDGDRHGGEGETQR